MPLCSTDSDKKFSRLVRMVLESLVDWVDHIVFWCVLHEMLNLFSCCMSNL
jgi:hypothetical protein